MKRSRWVLQPDVIPVPCYLHHFVLDVLSQTFFQGLGNHGDLVPANDVTQLSAFL